MPKTSDQSSPFTVIDALYRKYFGELTPGIALLLHGLVILMIAIAGGALLLGLGIFAF